MKLTRMQNEVNKTLLLLLLLLLLLFTVNCVICCARVLLHFVFQFLRVLKSLYCNPRRYYHLPRTPCLTFALLVQDVLQKRALACYMQVFDIDIINFDFNYNLSLTVPRLPFLQSKCVFGNRIKWHNESLNIRENISSCARLCNHWSSLDRVYPVSLK